MNRFLLISVLIVAAVHCCTAQAPRFVKCEPPNWWTGMMMHSLQLMIYGDHLEGVTATSASPHIKVVRTTVSANASYAFIDINITSSATPGNYKFVLTNARGETSFRLPLLKRTHLANEHQGFDCSDVIYLIATDRFANGDTTNDNAAGMYDSLKRDDPFGRHGGDLQGLIHRLPYLKDLGVTALWLMPVVENNMDRGSYHGYSATDLFNIDPRFGTNALYAEFVRKAHASGLKVIMDHVNNHIGTNHPWIKNLPARDWLTGTLETHQRPFHSKPELDDIHSDSSTKQKAINGWFDNRLADLNQLNPFVANYLNQSTIWWIESSGIDGIREDTYPYIVPRFREQWCKTVMTEYPHFNIVGEVWVQDPAFLAPYQKGGFIPRTIRPELPALTDFGLYDALLKTFADTSGTIENVFTCLAKDFLFPNPANLVTFLDNHDIRRIMFTVHGDVKRCTLALLTLLTTRGIPEILYGTEIGMPGGPDHGRLRADFPGGFPHDTRDAFTHEGRTSLEDSLFTFTRQLLHLRQSFTPLQCGALIHFKPTDEVYVYFRILGKERCLVVINHNRQSKSVTLSRYSEQLHGATGLKDMMSGKEYTGVESITLEGMTGGIFEVKMNGE
jgi:neopullulanase